MKKWKRTVNIKPFITGDSSDSGAQECARGIRETLLNTLMDDLTHDVELMAIVDDFEAVETCVDANHALDSLYDWADDNSVWLGFKT